MGATKDDDLGAPLHPSELHKLDGIANRGTRVPLAFNAYRDSFERFAFELGQRESLHMELSADA